MDSVCFDLEKENEDNSNRNETDVPSSTSKKRKRTKDTESKVLSCEKACKPRKKIKRQKKGFTLCLAKCYTLLLIIAIQICPFSLSFVEHVTKPTQCLNIIVSFINKQLNNNLCVSFQANA